MKDCYTVSGFRFHAGTRRQSRINRACASSQVHALHHLSTVSIAGHNRQIIPKYKINYAVVPARRPFSPLTSGFHCNYFPMDPATSTSPRINIALALSISKGSPARNLSSPIFLGCNSITPGFVISLQPPVKRIIRNSRDEHRIFEGNRSNAASSTLARRCSPILE